MRKEIPSFKSSQIILKKSIVKFPIRPPTKPWMNDFPCSAQWRSYLPINLDQRQMRVKHHRQVSSNLHEKSKKTISAMLQQEYHFFKRVSEMLRLTGLRYETTKVMQPDDQRNAA